MNPEQLLDTAAANYANSCSGVEVDIVLATTWTVAELSAAWPLARDYNEPRKAYRGKPPSTIDLGSFTS